MIKFAKKPKIRTHEDVLFTEREKASFVNEYSAGVKNFYTYKGSGRTFLQKKALRNIEIL